jgi:hypothetical protein
VRAVKPSRLEIADPAIVPPALLDSLIGMGIPCDVVIADAGLLSEEGISRPGARLRTQNRSNRRKEAARLCDVDDRSVQGSRHLRELAAKADRLLVPCSEAEAFVARYFPPGADRELLTCR